MTLDQAKLKAIEYARRDGKPWYVVFDMQYQAVSDDDRRFFYAFHVVNFTADPVFL